MERPNIVLIMSDQQRADSLGCYGNTFVDSPVIDRLAARGIICEHAFTPFPVCTPARGSMWTGLYPHAHGIVWNYYGVDNLFDEVATVKRTVFDALRDAGYQTAYFGKWHLGEKNPGSFTHWDAFNSRGGHWVDGRQSFQGGTWRPTAQTDAAIAYLRSDAVRSRPFVLVQGFYPPHNPYTAPEDFHRRYRGRGVPFPGYYASVTGLDHEVGRTLATLEETGLARNTVVVYFSDHGETFSFRARSKHKFVCHDEAIRVPFVVSWPGRWQGGGRVAAPVGLHDIAPTLYELAGLDPPQGLHGRSLVGLLDGDDRHWRSAFYVQNTTHDDRTDQRCLRTQEWKLILGADGRHSLYDLVDDPEEELDLYETPREDIHTQFRHFPPSGPIVERLAARLRDEARALDDALGVELAERVLAG